MNDNEIKTENSGYNSGMIVGSNSGTINNVYSINKAVKLPSHIANIIKKIADCDIYSENNDSVENNKEYIVEEKIKYNSLCVYNDIIKQQSVYYNICDKCLNIYDNTNANGKNIIFQRVKSIYLLAKGRALSEVKQSDKTESDKTEIEVIREKSDYIIENVKKEIFEKCEKHVNEGESDEESVELAIECFICYCFIECKILERPK